MKSIDFNEAIKARLEKYSIPVFAQVILIYTVVVFSIFLLMAYITFTNVHQALIEQNQRELQLTISKTLTYLNEYQKIDKTLLTQAAPQPYTNIQIYDQDNHLLLDNVSQLQTDNYLKVLEDPDKITDGQLVTSADDHGVPVFIKDYHWQANDGKIYTLRFSIVTTKESWFRDTLKNQFIIVNVLGFLLALGIGSLLAWRLMLPINKIKQALINIDFNHLERRINIPSRRNELYQLANSVNDTLDRLQDGIEQQKQFINDASHELRTPVTVIQGYTDLLMRWGKDDPATLNESVQAIYQETLYMKDLIENLLFLARSAQGRLSINMTSVYVPQLLETAYESNQIIITDKDFQLKEIAEGNIWGDFNLLLQLLRIFIENSNKYTAPGGSILLFSKRDFLKDEITITVKDTGIGIAKEQQNLIFERFYRVDESRTKDTGGNGLGLAIASQIVKIHNAKITVESDIDKGTAMILHFPIYRERKQTTDLIKEDSTLHE